MSSPYIQRRADALALRLAVPAVPAVLRPVFGQREIIRTLGTQDRRQAEPRALYVADAHQAELAERQRLYEQRRDLDVQAAAAAAAAAATARALLAPGAQVSPSVETQVQKSTPAAAPTLAVVVDAFLTSVPDRDSNGRPNQTKKKRRTAMRRLLEHVGETTPVSEIKQQHIGELLDDLAAKHASTVSTTYLPGLRAFVSFGRRRFGDQGFPGAALNDALAGAKYTGTRSNPERRQRPLTAEELTIYLDNPTLRAIAADPTRVCEYWLVTLPRYTGARVNEIAQINLRCDIAQTPDGGWWLTVTDEREPGAGAKSTKNAANRRRLPIHSALTAPFAEYVAALRRSGATALFPTLGKPSNPGQPAGRYLTKYVAAVGLRDEAVGRRVAGAHALRSTVERDLRQAGVIPEHRDALLGHVGADGEYRQSAVARGYLGDADADRALPDAMLRAAIDLLPVPPVLPAPIPQGQQLLPPRPGPKPRAR